MYTSFQSLAQREQFFQSGDDAFLFGKGRERNKHLIDICNCKPRLCCCCCVLIKIKRLKEIATPQNIGFCKLFNYYSVLGCIKQSISLVNISTQCTLTTNQGIMSRSVIISNISSTSVTSIAAISMFR